MLVGTAGGPVVDGHVMAVPSGDARLTGKALGGLGRVQVPGRVQHRGHEAGAVKPRPTAPGSVAAAVHVRRAEQAVGLADHRLDPVALLSRPVPSRQGHRPATSATPRLPARESPPFGPMTRLPWPACGQTGAVRWAAVTVARHRLRAVSKSSSRVNARGRELVRLGVVFLEVCLALGHGQLGGEQVVEGHRMAGRHAALGGGRGRRGAARLRAEVAEAADHVDELGLHDRQRRPRSR